MVLICICLMITDVEDLFMYVLAIFMSSLEKMSIQFPCLFLNWVVCCFFLIELYELFICFG